MEIMPIKTGEHFLQDVVVNPGLCYICKITIDKEDMTLLRVGEHKLSMCCLKHRGVVQEFINQFGRTPLGWEVQKYATD